MKELLRKGEHVVGLDIGGTKMLGLVLNHNFEVVGRCRKKTRAGASSEPNEARIQDVIKEAVRAAGSPVIKGIGVAAPGPLDPVRGILIDTPNLGWKNFPLGDVLGKAFKVPVVVENDVNAGTYGEWRFGKVKNCEDVLGVFPGTGIGGGIIINRKLLHGFSGAAGEIGHMTIEVDGPFCGCGKRGCLEAVASRLAIAKEVAALAARGDAPFVAEKFGTDLNSLRSGALAEAIAAGEQMVEAVVRKAAFYVGIGVANAINLLSPEAVVLGGGLVEAMEPLYLEEVRRAVKQHAMPFLRKGVRIVAAKLGDDAVALGVGRMAAEKVKKA